ncbi:DISARM system SNF2-like helicase DrmD [Geitlerinema sp. PCC 7407]|uniref:DISARM system SNF2-like helicase DrmD n=1 Tax=Geitlerinema sp. PCC 7407 TaxID=1173025 RepID=UPI00029F9A99|nr:DISARM system SNF2-like helicase DrmD [Geitlerinema sp. PCC 7407]AFY66688.1 helicase domain protein [Geitlerinema sp. PCC 7407]
MTDLSWDPSQANQLVRMRNNPGKQGKTTGKVVGSAGRLLVEVDFGPNEKKLRKFEQLEPVVKIEGIQDLLRKGSYGSLSDLRRILIYEKVKGQLTNILYSMESSNTQFYPHQFKPVLKFLDSPVGRLLIADEVGLGKTIEATFIWKELQARQDARRLLILCPAMLREKWKADLQNRFSVDAELINAQGLRDKVKRMLQNRSMQSNSSFIHIASLEGTRPPKRWIEPETTSPRAELARLLDQNPATDEFSIFDLVIIDEAHYLRNQETSNNTLGQLLRDASRHLVLLTATPIQISNVNLFQLLHLVSPEDFEYQQIFEDMIRANRHIINAQNALEQSEPDTYSLLESLSEARSNQYFRANSRLANLEGEVRKGDAPDLEKIIQWRQTLESCSLLGQFMTRSRKRDVLENRVKRSPQPLTISFSLIEKQIYNHISHQIRKLARDQTGIALFSLIVRQRQMASCMVAALREWKAKGILRQYVNTDNESLAENLWEDLGILFDEEEASEYQYPFSEIDFSDEDLEQLKTNDSKYQELIKLLRKELSRNPKEKFVLFAYFRGTLEYLRERLEEDRISSCIIHGGIASSKDSILKLFKDTNISVLLSSEVGSEGIDLQFCRFLINYDLPWNPMRVEQRIGRLDRLGQTANRISIIHYVINDTVEERILNKLYDRIDVFRESIGDLEEILGDKTETLILDLLNPDLSEHEREVRANLTLAAIETKKREQDRLEQEAGNMMAFGEYILNEITQSRQQGRWLRPADLKYFIDDFFQLYYPETTITSKQNGFIEISLSSQARIDLRLFCDKRRLATPTRLQVAPITCFFDPKEVESMGKGGFEFLDSTHPLIQWIRDEYEKKVKDAGVSHPFHSVSALEVSNEHVNCIPGTYLYVIHLWEFQGIRTETRLAFEAVRVEDKSRLLNNDIEALLDKALVYGSPKPNVINFVNQDEIFKLYEECEERLQLDFLKFGDAFEQENTDRCNVQEQSIRAYTNRKIRDLRERIEKLQLEGKLRPIPAFEGQLKRVQQDCEVNLKKIDQKRKYQDKNPELAAGLIFITQAS